MKEYIEKGTACEKMPDDIYGFRDKKILKSIPAADVVEVRHEKWTPAYYGHVNYARCTGCGSYFEDSIFCHEDSVEYCPHCGAKMDGGGRE